MAFLVKNGLVKGDKPARYGVMYTLTQDGQKALATLHEIDRLLSTG
jgi:DNA-binding PadR family transcriptional regulator